MDKINWKLKGKKNPETCAVMSWAEFEALEQKYYERGWEARRRFEEKRRVESARRSVTVNGDV